MAHEIHKTYNLKTHIAAFHEFMYWLMYLDGFNIKENFMIKKKVRRIQTFPNGDQLINLEEKSHYCMEYTSKMPHFDFLDQEKIDKIFATEYKEGDITYKVEYSTEAPRNIIIVYTYTDADNEDPNANVNQIKISRYVNMLGC